MKLIDKDVLVDEIKERIETYNKGYANGDDKRADALDILLHDLNTLEVKEVDLEKRTKILADIIFDAAKHGYMPYDTQDEHCTMEKARRNIIKLI